MWTAHRPASYSHCSVTSVSSRYSSLPFCFFTYLWKKKKLTTGVKPPVYLHIQLSVSVFMLPSLQITSWSSPPSCSVKGIRGDKLQNTDFLWVEVSSSSTPARPWGHKEPDVMCNRFVGWNVAVTRVHELPDKARGVKEGSVQPALRNYFQSPFQGESGWRAITNV